MTKGKRTCKADDWAFTIYFLPALINFNEEISFFWFVEVSFLCNLCGVVTATVASLEKSGTVVAYSSTLAMSCCSDAPQFAAVT